MKRDRLVWIVLVLLFLILICSPLIVWQLKPAQELHVAILDKTVPDDSFREHKGLMWVLNQAKYVKNGSSYRMREDYYGYVPESEGTYSVREWDQSESYDLIYIADTYGVYEDDINGNQQFGNRSEKIYGGLQREDVDLITDTLYQNRSTLIAEFNTFGSPTDAYARTRLEEMLGVSWTGWIGRYFNELTPGGELPVWAVENYEAQTGLAWEFQGAGFVFVNQKDEIYVLEEGKDIGKGGNTFELTDEGRSYFGTNMKNRYQYWFDIIEVVDRSEVLANYTLDVTAEGEQKLEELGIPIVFPAVIRHDNGLFQSFYFAGDYADNQEISRFYQMAWMDRIMSAFSWDTAKNENSFYWRVYVPMMQQILNRTVSGDGKAELAQAETTDIAGFKVSAQVGEDYLQVYRDGQWEDLLIKGVNIGMGKPGYFPGEAAITKAEYYRWFQQIGEMNANVIRNYTTHPPGFYEALLEYNRQTDNPIYLMQGVWVNEENLVALQDAFADKVTSEFITDIRTNVDVVHGNADLPHQPGHASGRYRADISEYVLGWIIGIEWDPEVVVETNDKHQGMSDFRGRYFETDEAAPFEVWLASMLEELTTYEADHYGWQRPVSFTNWVTTDLLEHPSEPLKDEDMVSVNPNLIHPTESFVGGYFASYHVYPYYPDFLNYEEKYTTYVDFRGKTNSYAGYLNDLKQTHTMPVLIAEFGQPTSRGITHRNIYGWNQGGNTEDEQGEYLTYMFEDIYHEKMAGGIVFAWQDEWFKRTWNTMELDNPDRRPFWSNTQTSEQKFGLLTFEPGTENDALYVDGDDADWDKENVVRSNVQPSIVQAEAVTESSHRLQQLSVTSDARNLYLKLDLDKELGTLDWDETSFMILLDTIPDQGQHLVPGGSGIKTETGIDFVIELRGPDASRVWVDSYYDPTYYEYGHILSMMEKVDYASKPNNGIWHEIHLVLNQPMTIPNVGGKSLELPLDTEETGKLRFGNGNPNHPDYDSLTDVSYLEDGRSIEIRIPWLMLNVKDPSTHEIIGDIWQGGLGLSVKTPGFCIAALSYRPEKESSVPGSKHISYALPGVVNNTLPSDEMLFYTWEAWELTDYHERLKKSYYTLQKLFEQTALTN